MKIAEAGTVSHGTLRRFDLVHSFSRKLDRLNDLRYRLSVMKPTSVAWFCDDDAYWDSDDCEWFIEELFDLLSEHAPEGHYFGAHEGDGADFGFWPCD